MGRKKTAGRAARGLVIIIVLAIVAAVLFFALHDGSWNHFRTDLFGSHRSTAIVHRPCGAPLPKLPGGAVAASRAARFATVEQIEQLTPGAAAPVYRVQARLLGVNEDGNEIRLELGSLVNPRMTLDAYVPASGCGATQEDTALYEELREVIGLRFGPLQTALTAPAQPTRVVAIGAVVAGPHGPELRPLLDLHVQ